MRVLLGIVFALGAVMGIPMDPERIRELLARSSRTEQAEVVPERPDDEDMDEQLRRLGLRSGLPLQSK